MARYKNGGRVSASTESMFGDRYRPGKEAPHPGIYRCIVCHDEIAIAGGHKLPPEPPEVHMHPHGGSIEWELLVFAEGKP